MAVRTVGQVCAGAGAPVPSGSGSEREPFRLGALVVVALALVPLIAAFVHSIGRWTPVGDDALLTLRAHDVLTEHHPLLGTWTSASITLGFDVNNPGPLLFDVLALPSRLPFREGPAAGVIAMQAVAVLGMVAVAWRRGGALLGALAALTAAALCWTMGSEVLLEPWQPYSLLLPFLLFLFLVWSTSCGDAWALPWLAGVGSFIVQTHVSYGFLIPVLTVWAVVGLVLDSRHRRSEAGSAGVPGARQLRGVVVVTMVVLAACWAQPLVEQLFGDGEGNLSRLVRASTEAPDPIGFERGARLVGSVVGLRPWFIRPSFGQAWYAVPPENGLPADGTALPGLAPAVTCLVGVAAVLTASWLVARGRRDRVASRALATAGLALGTGMVTVSRVPISQFGLAAHQFRFLWPLAAFLSFAILVLITRWASTRLAWRRPVVVGIAVASALIALLSLPASDQGASGRPSAMAVIRQIAPQLDALRGQGPLVIDDLFLSGLGDPFGAAILLELQERGIEFVSVSDPLGHQIGPRRVAQPEDARGVLIMETGAAARSPLPPGPDGWPSTRGRLVRSDVSCAA